MRNPSIHITRSNFLKVLDELHFAKTIGEKLEFADRFFQKARPFAQVNRSYVELNTASKKKAEKLMSLPVGKIEMFNGYLNKARIAAGHRGMKVITKASVDYATLVEVAQMADEFTETFMLPEPMGYTTFIDLGLTFMGKKYALNRFKYAKEQIYAFQEAQEMIINDVNPEGTQALHMDYCSQIEQESKFKVTYLANPLQYINFIYARDEADSVGAEYGHWVMAQFVGLAFAHALPDPHQLHGENAMNRYKKYMYKKGRDTEESPVFESEEEQVYYEKYLKKYE